MKCFNCGKVKADVREYAMRDEMESSYGMTLHPFCPQCRTGRAPWGILGIIDRVYPWDSVMLNAAAKAKRFCVDLLTPFPNVLPGLQCYECPGTVYEVDGWRVLTRVKLFPTDKAYKAHYEWHWWEPEDYLFLRRGWLHEEEMQCQGQRQTI